MESVSAAADDFIDMASLKILDLRMLQQDEIRCLAYICGNMPARLQDLVDVTVDKSMFNESAGSRKQTYDRDRIPRNKQRHFLSSLSPAQLHSAVESAGHSNKDLVIHLCRQLKISEKGDQALYQPQATQPSGVVVEGNRSMSLKRMARASGSFAGRADGAIGPPPKTAAESLMNGKEFTMEGMLQPSKKMKTKEEARRRAPEPQTVAVFQQDKHAFRTVKVTRKTGREIRSTDAGGLLTIGPSMNVPELSNYATEVSMESLHEEIQLPYICSTCEGRFSNLYRLKRHSAVTGHALDKGLKRGGIGRKRGKLKVQKNALHCSCGKTYATLFTLKRHARNNGHSFDLTNTPREISTVVAAQQLKLAKDEVKDEELSLKPGKQNAGVLLPERAWKISTGQFKCRQCNRQFVRQKSYIRHMETHYVRKKKEKVKVGHKRLRTQVGELKKKVKVRLGRRPKLKQKRYIKPDEVGQKRKHELASIVKRARVDNAEESFQQPAVYLPLGKPQSFTCQECGKIFNEFSRYASHQNTHTNLRRVLVREAGSLANIVYKENMLNLRDSSVLGFRRLLSEKTGTYLSGLPAKLLFSGSDPTKKEMSNA